LYYHSHLAYIEKNYETAYRGFEQLADDNKFAPIVPYYLTQILYEQKKYDEIQEYAPKYLESASTKRQPEISRILGEAYYKTGQFDKALPYLEQYYNEAGSFSKDDYYELGYVFYKTGNYEKAAGLLEKVTDENDTIAQNAFYHLADCYVQLGEKNKARNAFFAAADKGVDKDMTEDAMFSYAKITYELSHSPFNETIKAFEDYLEKYPTSKKRDEVYAFLVKVYMSSKNYKDALVSIEKIKKRSSEINMAYQRVAYFRGLELFNNLEFEESVELFNKSLTYGMYDKNIKALCYYWKAEALYRQEQYAQAQESFSIFLLSPGALNKPEYKLAHYDLGYSYFKLKDYPKAGIWFRKYIDLPDADRSGQYIDACNRIGDSYFMLRDYTKAVSFYKKAYEKRAVDADYALFQQGFCQGLLKNPDLKISLMKQLLKDYPVSAYADDAAYELAQGHMSKDEYVQAKPYYEQIIADFPNSSYVKKSLLQLGLIYYSENSMEKALEAYKNVLEQYAGSPESRHALTGLKNIYINLNDVDGYVTYVEGLGDFAKVSVAEQDSLNYLAAEDAYMHNECEKAKDLFANYLDKFPEGTFALNANYYRSDCYAREENFDSALVGYTYIISRAKNQFTEQSLLYAAKICMSTEAYENAAEYYSELEKNAELKSNMLEARLGQMYAYEKLENHEECLKAADKLLVTDKVSEEQIRATNFIMAKAYLALQDTVQALIKYRTVALDVSNEAGAESKYTVCQLLFDQKKYGEAESEVLSFLDMGSPHQFWLGKSYILWGDIFFAKDDMFQAKYTYKSVIDNYVVADDGIIDTAAKRYDDVVEAEELRNNQPKEQMQIDFYESENQQLFNENAAADTTANN